MKAPTTTIQPSHISHVKRVETAWPIPGGGEGVTVIGIVANSLRPLPLLMLSPHVE
jgi:hypothetical protein